VNRKLQNDCVAAQLLVTFFRPPRESYMLSESAAGSMSLAGAALPFRDWHQNKFARAVPRPRSAIQAYMIQVYMIQVYMIQVYTIQCLHLVRFSGSQDSCVVNHQYKIEQH
jgi:hypothetical protein